MNTPRFTLISHPLCPFIQRAVIILNENKLPFERRHIDPDNKPTWFKHLSPMGETPLLMVNEEMVIFESSAISEYINDVTRSKLLSNNPLKRAQQRGWVEHSASIMNTTTDLYQADTQEAVEHAKSKLHQQWYVLNQAISGKPYFSGEQFSLVDAAFAPVFRHIDILHSIANIDTLENHKKLKLWSQHLAQRPSVQLAVNTHFGTQLKLLISQFNSVLGYFARIELKKEHQLLA